MNKYLQMLCPSLFWTLSAFWRPRDSGWGKGESGIQQKNQNSHSSHEETKAKEMFGLSCSSGLFLGSI